MEYVDLKQLRKGSPSWNSTLPDYGSEYS